jgi:hypothetical protein
METKDTLWEVDLEASTNRILVINETLFVATRDGPVVVLDPVTGAVVRRFDTPAVGSVRGLLAFDPCLVLIGVFGKLIASGCLKLKFSD